MRTKKTIQNIKNKNVLFWALQFTGWFTINAISFISGFTLSMEYILYSYIVYSLMGIVLTSIFRWYLKRNIKIDWYGKSDITHLIITILICILVFLGSYYLMEYIYDVFWGRTASEIEYFEQFAGFGSLLFSSAFMVVGWTAIYYGVKIYLQRDKYQNEQLELKVALREAQLNTLKGQVNPHFMFNSLNNIRGLMLEDVEKSSEMITKLSEMLEYAVEKNTVDTITIREELDMVQNYIALSKIQMEDRLQYVENVAEDTLSLAIPPMIIQLLVENAAKHGISTLKDGGVIEVQINKDSSNLFITVSNTGKLKLKSNSTQLGLKNIRQRLRLLYGKQAQFLLEEKENTVVANIKIPLV